MNILVTGAKGFVGKNLCANLKNIRDGRDGHRADIMIDDIFEYDVDTDPALLEEYAEKADFVFHLAGTNRSEAPEDFTRGNVGFASVLLGALQKRGNPCPVMIASSIQATCLGRYDSDYGRSKRAEEALAFAYEKETGAEVLVYRFPNVFGKWCRPDYNSVVATFCHRIANDLPIAVSDPSTPMELLYIDDLVAEMLDALRGGAHRCEFDGVEVIPCEKGRYCAAPITHKTTLGEIALLLESFKVKSADLIMPEIPLGSFAKKLYSTYLSYLPKDKISVALKKNEDARGSFTELLKTEKCGQLSVNISVPGATKGQHWHNTKWELFVVVAGRGLVRQRRIDTDEVLQFEVSGERPEAIRMLPGYTHEIVNLSETENLVTVMWANEQFDPKNPDTFFEEV